MERFPAEILALVVKFLPLAALREFRLVSRRLADVAYPVLVQHLSVVNTAECLEEFKLFINKSQIASHTKRLTIYHGTWPICTRDAWETHPLLLGGYHRMDIGCQRSHAADQAYQDYKSFIAREGSRKPSDLEGIIQLLPNLRSIVLTHLRTSHLKQPQYSRLRRKIWLQPYLKDFVSPTITWVLGALDDFCEVKEIEINSNFNPHDIEGPVRAKYIERLRITSMKCSNPQRLSIFLSSFSRVRKLFLEINEVDHSTNIPLDDVLWPNLEEMELTNGRVSEVSMVGFIQRHSRLSILRVRGTSVIGGSWESILQQVHSQHRSGFTGAGLVMTVHASDFPDASYIQPDRVHPVLWSTLSLHQVLGLSS